MLSPALQSRLAQAGPTETFRVHAVMAYQSDARKVRQQASAKGLSREQRADRVVAHLKRENIAAQAPLVQELQTLPGVSRIEARWIVNLVGFDATAAAIAKLAQRSDIIGINLELPWVFEGVTSSATAVASPNGAEIGLKRINAPAMWKRGYTGFGGISLTSDTGVDPFHPALNHKYAGHEGRSVSWFANGLSVNPEDCGDHGTHVTGTILGLDRVTKDTIGVAPNAHWLGGAVLCGFAASDNLRLFEWALDPDGDEATSADRPFVINNSWYDPSIRDFECSVQNPYPQILDNLQAAGIAVVWSAGNDGPNPSTITPPHSYNSNITNAFTVGALNGNRSNLLIADFSSRGPASCVAGAEELNIKPEVSAPGVDVRSTLPGGGYGTKSGTSMASPHTAGAVLLLHEAFPDLDGDEILKALYFSARDLGEPGEDNTYGRGIIDVDAAYQYIIDNGTAATPAEVPAMRVNVIASAGEEKQCSGPVEISVTLANSSAEAITSIKYQLDGLTDDPIVLRSDVTIAAGETSLVELRPKNTKLGRHMVTFRLLEVNAQPVDRRLDLGATWEINFSQNERPTLVVDRADTTFCLGSPVELSLRSTLPDQPVLFFSPDPRISVVPVTAGPRFILPSLDRDITLYGISEYRRSGGPDYPDTEENLVFVDGSESSLRFRALADGIIRSVTVNQLTSGRIIMELKLAENLETVGRYNAGTRAGLNQLETFLKVEAGVLYVLEITRAPKLAFRTDLPVNRTSVPGFIKFQSATATTPAVANGSFFLFDWTIGYEDGCPVTPITLRPDSSRTAGERQLVVTDTDVIEGETFTARDAKFPVGTDYTWTFDNVVLNSEMESVEVISDEVGSFLLRMTTVDENRCAAAAEQLVVVTERSSSTTEGEEARALTLYPNPTTESFSLEGDFVRVDRIEIFDAAGRNVKTYSGLQARYPVTDLASGMYVVRTSRVDGSFESVPLEIKR